MYRLVLYELVLILASAFLLACFRLLPYSPFAILASVVWLLVVCYVANVIFAYAFDVGPNVESVYITAFILALLYTPMSSYHALPLLGWAGVLAIGSKYMFALRKKHIFNPVAIAGVLTAFWLGQSAHWWVGTAYLAPVIVITGLLTVKKIQKEWLVGSFFITSLITFTLFILTSGSDLWVSYERLFLQSSLLFFAFIMLTEPLTTPPTKKLQILYGGLVGILFVPQIHIGSVYSTPELALVLGNIFSYLVSPKQKIILYLKEKLQFGDMIDFIFTPSEKLAFVPGQYMEWTLSHSNSDSRGNRRYFTLASSPTEEEVHLGVRFAVVNGSSFKKALVILDEKKQLVVGSLAGDFTLPTDPAEKCVFVAGGIGITPFRSMIKYCIDTNQKRDFVLLYSNKKAEDILYRDVFDLAEQLGINTVYTLTDTASIPVDWTGKTGRISSEMIMQEVPDFKERMFYLSGPHEMIVGFEQTLRDMGIPSKQIKKDFFPGFV